MGKYKILAALAIAFSLAACCGTDATGISRASCAAPSAAPCSQSACSSAAPLSAVGDYAVEYGQPGAREQAKAFFSIPAGAIDCVTTGAAEGLVVIGKTARCLVNSFFPPLEPSSRLVRLNTVSSVQSACGPQTVEVEETYQEPETRMVTKTRRVQKVIVPIQTAPAPRAAPCAPAPQAAPVQPKSGCEPVSRVCDPNDPTSPCFVPDHTETASK